MPGLHLIVNFVPCSFWREPLSRPHSSPLTSPPTAMEPVVSASTVPRALNSAAAVDGHRSFPLWSLRTGVNTKEMVVVFPFAQVTMPVWLSSDPAPPVLARSEHPVNANGPEGKGPSNPVHPVPRLAEAMPHLSPPWNLRRKPPSVFNLLQVGACLSPRARSRACEERPSTAICPYGVAGSE
jgi:hypothetical protein